MTRSVPVVVGQTALTSSTAATATTRFTASKAKTISKAVPGPGTIHFTVVAAMTHYPARGAETTSMVTTVTTRSTAEMTKIMLKAELATTRSTAELAVTITLMEEMGMTTWQVGPVATTLSAASA